MKKDMKKVLSGAAGAAMLVSGAAQTAVAETGYDVAVKDASAVAFNKVANVEGAFAFDQDVVTPADEVFSIFGTVVTGMCAKPDFAIGTEKTDYYVNVGGKIAKAYTVDLKQKKAESRILLCSCATGAATANAQITGVRLSDVLQLAEMDKDVNTVTVRTADGYGLKLPLQYALDKEAMIVYQVGGRDIPSGTPFWVPETDAKYFTRDVVDIELTAEAEAPEVEQRDEALRAEVAIMNTVESKTLKAGETVTFEGYADDCGDAIAAVEFSLDGGETWTSYETANATAEKWVYWHFSYTPETAGAYQLSVRARTTDGNVSPLAANVEFSVM